MMFSKWLYMSQHRPQMNLTSFSNHTKEMKQKQCTEERGGSERETKHGAQIEMRRVRTITVTVH